MTAEDEHLLALATLTGGFAVSLLPRVRAEELIPTPRAFRPRRFEVMTGRAASTRVAPLEPDVVGELFTLDLLAPAHDADGWRVEALWRSAWATAPREMAAFLRRAFTDYPEHPALAAIARLAEDWPIGELAAGDDVGPYVAQTLLDVWLLHRNRLIHGHAPLLGDDGIRAIYDRIEWLRQATGADPRVEVIWVEAQFQLGSMLANARQADEALECYRKLSRALEVSPESRDRINEGRLRLGPNVMRVLAACDRIAEAGALLPELREAARAHPDRLAASFGELASAQVLARAYLERGDVRTALQVYRGVADESLVALLDRELLRDLVSVSLLYGHASEIAPEVTRLEQLWGEEDAGSAPAMPEERLLTDLVLARYRLVTGQAFQLGPLLKEVGAVVAREPPEQTLAAVRGEMFYFGLAVADTRRFDELSDVYEAFSAALGAQPHQGSLAKAVLLRQFVVRLREAEELDAAVGWFGRLTELFEGTRDTAVSEYWSTARTSLIIALLDRGALDAAKVIHEWGAPTVSSMDGASAGREAHAKDALRIMVACRSANDVDSALEVFHRLDVVRLAFPEEAVLLQAKVYGINLLQDLGSDPRVRQVITTSIEQDPALTFS